MKTAIAAISTALALLIADAAQAQLQNPSQGPSRVSDPRGNTSSPRAVRLPLPVRSPSLVQPPFFGRHPLFSSGLFVPFQAAVAPSAYVYYPYPTPIYVPYPAYGESQPQYWAYCQSAHAYYPYVPECPGGWLPVLPTSTPPPARVSDDTERELKQTPPVGMPIEELRKRIARSRAD